MRFAFIDAWRHQWRLATLCRVMRVSERGYRSYWRRPEYVATIGTGWCGRRDLNPHSHEEKQILSLLRLPVSPRPRTSAFQKGSARRSSSTNADQTFNRSRISLPGLK